MNFPHSCVLYLRHNGNTPKHLQVKVNMPDGEQVTYQVPSVRVQEYTRDEIFRKRLLFFLPFYIMRYEKELNGISENSSRLEELAGEYEEIRKQLGMMLVREEKTDLYLRLMGVIKEISNYMLREEGTAQERMGEIMGGKVLELEADRILEVVGENTGHIYFHFHKNIWKNRTKYGIVISEYCYEFCQPLCNM